MSYFLQKYDIVHLTSKKLTNELYIYQKITAGDVILGRTIFPALGVDFLPRIISSAVDSFFYLLS
jgi:hypothetical protein